MDHLGNWTWRHCSSSQTLVRRGLNAKRQTRFTSRSKVEDKNNFQLACSFSSSLRVTGLKALIHYGGKYSLKELFLQLCNRKFDDEFKIFKNVLLLLFFFLVMNDSQCVSYSV